MQNPASPRFPLTHFTVNLTPTGFPFLGEGLPLGYRFEETFTGRTFRFVQFELSGVSCKSGDPVGWVSAGRYVVSPDISDIGGSVAGSTAGAMHGFGFAGIALASHAPTSGSTTYGWIMTKGPLGKIAGSMLSTTNLKVYICTAISIRCGRPFSIRSTDDRYFWPISTHALSTAWRNQVNVIALDNVAGSKISCSAGFIVSPYGG